MSELFSRQTRTEAVTVKSFERLTSLSVSGDHFAAVYQRTLALPDGTELGAGGFSVDRSIEAADSDVIDFGGSKVTLADWIAMGAQFSELWRDQNEKVSAAANAELAATATIDG